MTQSSANVSSALSPHILVVDDDRRLRQLLRRYLEDQGHAVTEAADAAQARTLLTLYRFDLMVLDVMMPGETGLEFVRNFPTRKIDPPPILMLTALDTADDRVMGLEAGVEDYLTKPFEPKELLLRIGNILRRAKPLEISSVVVFGGYEFDRVSAILKSPEGEVYLTSAEAELLSILSSQIGQTVSRDRLVALMGEQESESRKVDVTIGRLRKKIEPESPRPRYIQTVRGEGYRLMA